MSKGLEALDKVIKTYFIHNMNEELDIIEKELKERQYLYHLLDSLFDECEVGISADYDEDLRKYIIEFQIDGKYKFHIYCDHKEYIYWKKMSGVDDQYGPEDLR